MYLGGPVNSIKITLISLFIASSAYAEEIVKFVSLDACKVYYAKSVTPVAGETVDTYCKNRIMSFIEACTATKIAEYVTAQKLKAFTDLSDTEQRTKKATFTYQCQVTSQNEVAGNARNAANARAAASVGSAGGGANSATATQQKVANAQMAVQLAEQSAKIADRIDKATSATGKGSFSDSLAGERARNEKVQSENAELKKLMDKDSAPTTQTNASTNAQPAAAATSNETPAVQGSTTAAADTASVPQLTPQQAEQAVQAGTEATKVLDAQGKEIVKAMPETKSAVDSIGEASKVSPDAKAPKETAISELADSTSTKLKTDVQATINQTTKVVTTQVMDYPVFVDTPAQLKKLDASLVEYTDQKKKTCSSRAETASYLCVEGTSPGAIAAKELMNSAGPILSIISSAQKTCSSTAKVTQLVGTGLTIAKGVCVASKLVCDSTCATAVAGLTKMQASVKTEIGSSINADYNQAIGYCDSLSQMKYSQCKASTVGMDFSACDAAKMTYYNGCVGDMNQKRAAAISGANKIVSSFQLENNAATSGTSPALVKGCANHGKDIALFAVQLLGTYAAQKNAKACEEKLASNGAAAANISTQQYCEKSENVSSQICVCQKNPMASGCPGAVMADSSSTNGSAEKGTNIKNVGGNSAFAGGFGTGKKPDFSSSNLGKDSINGALAGAASGDESAGGLGGFGGGGLSGGGGGALGGVPASAAEAVLKKEAEEKKKWSFGAFGSSDGGGGANGGTAGNKYKSGALTTGDQAAIQRQIASEKYAAEVSTASGKSNWEKIRNMYLIKENSFIFGQ